MAPARVLVVCTGNICRSPLVERVLGAALAARWGAAAVTVSSAGTSALVDSPMDERSGDLLRLLGGDPEGHLGRRLTRDLVSGADLVLTATRAHRSAVVRLHPRALRTTFTLRDFADLAARVPDEDLPREATAVGQVRAVVALLASRRGLTPPLADDLADVVDPYRRPDAVYAEMLAQLREALPQVIRPLVTD